MTEENALTIYSYNPSTSVQLSGALVGLRENIEVAARASLDAAMDEDADWTETEQLAMLRIEQLRQVNGLDLAAVLLRAEYLQEIEGNNLISRHPAGYANMGEMARDQGISLAELSQTLDLANVVFPYVQQFVAIPVLWEQIGKSNMRELVPVLKCIITGVDAGAQSVNDAAQRILDDVVLTFANADRPDDAEDRDIVRRAAVEQLLEHGATLTNRELRQQIRPERTPAAEVTTFSTPDETIVIAAELTPEQWELFMRRMGAYADPMPFVAANDAAQRQRDALGIRALRRIIDVVGGADA